jgi:hypothetical protein
MIKNTLTGIIRKKNYIDTCSYFCMNHFAGLKYGNSFNLGDYIQSIAAERFIPKISRRLDRDMLTTLSGKKKCLLITNGWFSHTPEMCYPFSHTIILLFLRQDFRPWLSA